MKLPRAVQDKMMERAMRSEDIPVDCTEQAFSRWMEGNALEVLKRVGLTEGQTALDYGCGSGRFAIPAARIVGERGKVCALDIDANALVSLRNKAESEGVRNVGTITAEATGAKALLPTEAFDAILLYDVLQMIEDKRSLLRELHQSLKPRGFLSIFPMHIGAERMLQIVAEDALFSLRDRCGQILNFARAASPVAARGERGD